MQLVTEDNITDLAVERWATAKDPRLAEIMAAFVRHLHELRPRGAPHRGRVDGRRPVAATAPGRSATRSGRSSSSPPTCWAFRCSSCMMNNRLDADATPNTVLGPFHIDGSPPLAFGADMSDGLDGTPLFIHGVVRDLSGKPVGGAVLDVWQADADGMYEAQLDVDEARLRAKYATREDGSYCVRTVAPLGYAIPMDGPVGELIGATAISHFRPAHVHVLIDVPGYEPPHHPLLPGRGGVPRQRRRVRHQGGARRRVRAEGAGSDARRRRDRPAVALGARTTSCCSPAEGESRVSTRRVPQTNTASPAFRHGEFGIRARCP